MAFLRLGRWSLQGVCVAVSFMAALLAKLTLLIVRGVFGLRNLKALGKEVRCPNGCTPEAADGWWQCTACKGRFVGWAFGGCPVCGHEPGHIACGTCGHAIVNPWVLGP